MEKVDDFETNLLLPLLHINTSMSPILTFVYNFTGKKLKTLILLFLIFFSNIMISFGQQQQVNKFCIVVNRTWRRGW